jgi:nucleotide-binding universal stress UspA family protein
MEETMSTHVETPRPAAVEGSSCVREILFPSDLSPESARTFAYARMLAERFHARLALLHVVPSGSPDGLRAPETARRAERSAREQLERWVAGVACRQCVIVERAPSVPAALVGYLHGTTPDLVVMSTHGREGLARKLFGSVAESVVRDGRTPVLCVREPEHGVALPFRRILVPTDLSPGSRRPFRLAALIARAFKSTVVALHVGRVGEGRLADVTAAVESALPSEAALREFLRPEFDADTVTARVELGSTAAERIVQVAKEEKADLIVMSTHGHDSLRDRVLGSQTEHVVRAAPCPVLVA